MDVSETIYPLTIVKDRYTGAYSGGEYTAWELYSDEVPAEIHADDVVCMRFWGSPITQKYIPVGRGATPEDAVKDLANRLKGEGRL